MGAALDNVDDIVPDVVNKTVFVIYPAAPIAAEVVL